MKQWDRKEIPETELHIQGHLMRKAGGGDGRREIMVFSGNSAASSTYLYGKKFLNIDLFLLPKTKTILSKLQN